MATYAIAFIVVQFVYWFGRWQGKREQPALPVRDDKLSLPASAEAFREFLLVTNGSVSEEEDKLLKAAATAVLPPIEKKKKKLPKNEAETEALTDQFWTDMHSCIDSDERMRTFGRYTNRGVMLMRSARLQLLKIAISSKERDFYRDIFDEWESK